MSSDSSIETYIHQTDLRRRAASFQSLRNLETVSIVAPLPETLPSSDERVTCKKLLLGEQHDSYDAPERISGIPLRRQIFSAKRTRKSSSRTVQINGGRHYVNTRQGVWCPQQSTKMTSPVKVSRIRDNLKWNQPAIGP